MLLGQELVADFKVNLPVGNTALEDKNLVFLFQMDSITDRNRGCIDDPNHIMNHGYVHSVSCRIGVDFLKPNLSSTTVVLLEILFQTLKNAGKQIPSTLSQMF